MEARQPAVEARLADEEQHDGRHVQGRRARSRSGTASSTTQTTSVFCKSAAWVDVDLLNPSKNNRNGTLPPMTPTIASPSHSTGRRGRAGASGAAGRNEPPSPASASAATRFFAVV